MKLIFKSIVFLFGNKKGIAILNNDTGSMTSYDNANSALPLFRIQTVTFDNTNNIWFGTFTDGLGKCKVGNF
ncbi:MAG: hypothetical protein M1495_16740 [Bacteroidetes bacterium]|nr:hypothetical protein [Bacteroidota bacterium]